jgi:nucleotide-binding universal stress UspA family protein
MHLTVGYLATLTGDDGVALAGALATTFDAQVDVILVVREELPDGHPGRAEYQHFLIERGEEWISKAIDALAAKGVSATSTVLVGESYAESLIEFAQQKTSDLIVIGGARDGMFGGHVIGSVAGALLHRSPVPVALAPRGYAEDPPVAISRSRRRYPRARGRTIRCRSRSRWPAPPGCQFEPFRWCQRRTSPRRRTSRNCGKCRWPPLSGTARSPPAHCPTHPRSNAWWPTA